jgi:hypothetical protein
MITRIKSNYTNDETLKSDTILFWSAFIVYNSKILNA